MALRTLSPCDRAGRIYLFKSLTRSAVVSIARTAVYNAVYNQQKTNPNSDSVARSRYQMEKGSIDRLDQIVLCDNGRLLPDDDLSKGLHAIGPVEGYTILVRDLSAATQDHTVNSVRNKTNDNYVLTIMEVLKMNGQELDMTLKTSSRLDQHRLRECAT